MLLRLLIIALLLYVTVRVAFWFLRQVKLYLSQEKTRSVSRRNASEMVQDPICGVYVAISQARKEVTGSGTFYFCSRECQQRFLEAHR
jgi:uncharacterized protein